MKFSIVTPCWNAAGLIGDTVRSIAAQTLASSTEHEIEYIVVDGESSDDTVAEVRAAWTDTDRATLTVVSEPDQGMYDALAKGLRRVTGDVVSYLNAGDYYSPYCLDVVRTCMDDLDAQWITGMRVLYNDAGAVISARTPYRYDTTLIKAGFYGIRGHGRFIQQESTFWRAGLLDAAAIDEVRRFKLAGDFYLWTRLAERADLEIVAAHLGGFRLHGGHLSDARDRYLDEAMSVAAKGSPLGYVRAPLHELLSSVPLEFRRLFPRSTPLISWDTERGAWLRKR